MPILLWLLGVPFSLIIILMLLGLTEPTEGRAEVAQQSGHAHVASANTARSSSFSPMLGE